ncbi:MAG: peptide deformylase [Candidatus Saccharimonadales bacterium]
MSHIRTQPKLLKFTRFGNPILRHVARQLSIEEIMLDTIKQLIADMRYTCEKEKAGVGLAAPQVGESIALSVIAIKPTPNRPDRERFDTVIINPDYEGIGRRIGMWEGCISCGRRKDTLFGKAMRYSKIRAKWYDEYGEFHDEIISGFPAHVFQHETDHLTGILFVDRVKDPATYMMADEYRKRIMKKS